MSDAPIGLLFYTSFGLNGTLKPGGVLRPQADVNLHRILAQGCLRMKNDIVCGFILLLFSAANPDHVPYPANALSLDP